MREADTRHPSQDVVTLEVFSDYVCPFCWLAAPAVQEVARDPGVEVIWRAYELRPDPAPTLDPAGDYLRTTWEDAVYPLADRLGMTLRLPPVQPRSRRAHAATRWARSQNRFDAFHEAVFRAFFEDGQDIGDVDVLVRLADGLGLDGGALRGALLAERYEPVVLAEEERAGHLGLRGVPAFVAASMVALTGVRPADDLRTLIAEARARRQGLVTAR